MSFQNLESIRRTKIDLELFRGVAILTALTIPGCYTECCHPDTLILGRSHQLTSTRIGVCHAAND